MINDTESRDGFKKGDKVEVDDGAIGVIVGFEEGSSRAILHIGQEWRVSTRSLTLLDKQDVCIDCGRLRELERKQ